VAGSRCIDCLRIGVSPSAELGPLPVYIADQLALLDDVFTEALVSSLMAVLDATDWNGLLPFVMGAAVKRSAELLQGFADLARSRNCQAALPILRAHLDTAMRLHGLWLVDDLDAYFKALATGNVRGLTSRDGRKLHDRVLHEELSHHYPGLSEQYGELSGAVHLSTYAVASHVRPAASGGFGLHLDPCDWADVGVCAATIGFGHCSAVIAHMFSVLGSAAKSGEIQRVFQPDGSRFSATPMPAWAASFVCQHGTK